MSNPPTVPTGGREQTPQYKPGDIANGHQLTVQSDGTQAWLPVGAPPAAVSKKGPVLSRRPVQIALGVLALLVVITIIGSLNQKPKTTDVASTSNLGQVASEPTKSAVPVSVQVTVADVTGRSVPDATDTLTLLGLKIAPGADPEGTVTGTDPVAGTSVEKGSTVTLTFTVPPKLTLAQQNAVKTAQDYLKYQSFSRSGLIHQLEYEGYATDVATFAVDYSPTDWNAQAGATAADYLKNQAFSRKGLYDQLIYEGFSDAEANAGLAAVGY
jgi:PASTA domain/Host cell surface-exposed lipoprotein